MSEPSPERPVHHPEVLPASPAEPQGAGAPFDVSALLGGGGGEGLDLGGLLAQAQAMSAGLADAQVAAAATVVEGDAGGGAVRIEATAGMEFRAVHIRPDAIDPDDVDLLEDLVLAALRDVAAKAAKVSADAMGPLAGMGDLGGLLGG